MDVSLIIPVYNESKIILNTIRTASKKLAELTSSYEILIVDDGSTDGTAALVENCRDSHVFLIHYAPNHGKGMAVRTGMLTAKGNIIICTDADLAYGVDVFGRILGRFATTDTDIVAGTRSDRADAYQNYPPLRRFISKGFRLVVFAVLIAQGSRYPLPYRCDLQAQTSVVETTVCLPPLNGFDSCNQQILVKSNKLANLSHTGPPRTLPFIQLPQTVGIVSWKRGDPDGAFEGNFVFCVKFSAESTVLLSSLHRIRNYIDEDINSHLNSPFFSISQPETRAGRLLLHTAFFSLH